MKNDEKTSTDENDTCSNVDKVRISEQADKDEGKEEERSERSEPASVSPRKVLALLCESVESSGKRSSKQQFEMLRIGLLLLSKEWETTQALIQDDVASLAQANDTRDEDTTTSRTAAICRLQQTSAEQAELSSSLRRLLSSGIEEVTQLQARTALLEMSLAQNGHAAKVSDMMVSSVILEIFVSD